jgi:hypothetical protein
MVKPARIVIPSSIGLLFDGRLLASLRRAFRQGGEALSRTPVARAGNRWEIR